MPPVEPLDGCTTYRLSYWPHCEKRRSPFTMEANDNLLNAGCCSDNNTTYRLSYFGCEGDKRHPIMQPGNICFSSCPAAYDTINRVRNIRNKQDFSILYVYTIEIREHIVLQFRHLNTTMFY